MFSNSRTARERNIEHNVDRRADNRISIGNCHLLKQNGVSDSDSGQPAGFVDGQQMGVFKQDFEVLRGVWFDPGWTVPDKGLA
jgi:hypothetical protein